MLLTFLNGLMAPKGAEHRTPQLLLEALLSYGIHDAHHV